MSHGGPGQVEISITYRRHIGPTFVHGGLTLQFDSLKPYAFVSQARWPSVANYEDTIRKAVEQALRARQGHLRTTLVVLRRIECDDVESSELGFRNAAVAATRAAFEL
jgi:hypothetical protein